MDGSDVARWPDEELVRAALHGEKDAFAVLVTRHWATAVALASRFLGSPDLARDAAQEETPRPLTYQMTGRILEATGSVVTEVRITRLADKVFYALVVVDGPAGRHEVDARPSDAVNLALVTGAPVRVDSALLDDPRAQAAADHPALAGPPGRDSGAGR